MNDEQEGGWDPETGERRYKVNEGTPMVTSWYCHHCGMWSSNGELEDHECQPDILVAHQAGVFEDQFGFFLKTTEGKFAQHLAKREVRDEHSVEE